VKAQGFIVSTRVGHRERKVFWDGHEPFALDHPAHWFLERTPEGVVACNRGDEFALGFTDNDVRAGTRVALPAPSNISVSVRKLNPVRAAYHPARWPKSAPSRPPQFFIFKGQRYLMVSYKPVENGYQGRVEGKSVWGFVRNNMGFQITAYRPGVKIKMPDGKRKTLTIGNTEYLNDGDFGRATVTWERYWWRVNRVPTPEALPLETFTDAAAIERRWFTRFSATVVAALIAGFFTVNRFAEDYRKVEIPKAPTVISLKQPKIIHSPAKAKPKPPEPPKVAKVEPPKAKPKPPEPPKKKPEPPKMVAKKPEPPKRKPEPPKVVVKKPVVQKPVAKLPPPPTRPAPKLALQQPKAPPIAKLPPAPPKTSVAPPPPPVPKGPTPEQLQAIQRAAAAQEKAKKQAELARALNFLSPSVNKKASGGIIQDNTIQKYNAGGPSAVAASQTAKGSSVLNSMAAGHTQEGVIQTTSARNIASDKFSASGGRGKGLNDVQGKVSLQALYDPNAGADLGGSLSGKGLSVSGPGQLSDSEIQKALAKHLSRFQYCYEKALLNNPSLGGSITMQWTIQMSGSASDVRVQRSAMNHPGLHSCMIKELGSISFPRPKGGSVTIKYPFAFSSQTI
jgi:hypothetical protein